MTYGIRIDVSEAKEIGETSYVTVANKNYGFPTRFEIERRRDDYAAHLNLAGGMISFRPEARFRDAVGHCVAHWIRMHRER